MKRHLPFFLLLFSTIAHAQIDTLLHPPGYTPAQLSRKNILRIAPDNHLWVGYKNIGAGEYDGAVWKMYTDTNGLPSNNVTALAFSGTIKWIGTDNGLVKTDGINIITFNTVNSPLPSNNINSLYVADTTLWIATNGGAVSFNGTNWAIYNTSNSPLTSDTIYSFGENLFGLYIADKNTVSVLTSSGWKNTSPVMPALQRFNTDRNGNLFAEGFHIKDSVFLPLNFESNPCKYSDILQLQPLYILGGSSNFTTFAVHRLLGYSIPEQFLFEFDNTLSLQKELIIPSLGVYDLFRFLSNKLNFDISVNDELYFTDTYRDIYKIAFSPFLPIAEPDSCPYLDINNVCARVSNTGTMFTATTFEPLYEVPKRTGKSPIFTEGLWIGGKDPQGKLHIAAQTYRQSGDDFWPGPLDTINATIDPATFLQYDKLWKINLFTINEFIENYMDGSVTNGTYSIPSIIADWPAHGNGSYARMLAPFVDNNLDGNYNPYDGDYPKIKGDQMFWWVFNDAYASHENTNSPYKLGVEVHGSAYAYSCPLATGNDSVINYTTFYHYDFINRSDTNYQDVYMGIFTDVELGNYSDDYVGCDTLLDIAFAYNGENEDVGNNGYGLNPPMINLAVLEGPEPDLSDGMDNDHDGMTDETGEKCMMNYFNDYHKSPSVDGFPITANQYYFRLQGLWLDSTHVTYSGNGYQSSTTNTNYMYSGFPYDSTVWSELHPDTGSFSNYPEDRRLFVSSGPFSLPVHEKRSIDFAYVYTRDPNNPNGPNTSFRVNSEQVARIKHFFETDSFPCKHLIGIDELRNDFFQIYLSPNPAQSSLTVSINKNSKDVQSFFVTDILGRSIQKSIPVLSSSFSIDVSNFSKGIYLLNVLSTKGMVVKKFVVN